MDTLKDIKIEVKEMKKDNGTDNNYCANADFCKDCTYKTEDNERNQCRKTHLMLLTESEQGAAVKDGLKPLTKDIKWSAKTKRWMSYDSLCAAQRDKVLALIRQEVEKVENPYPITVRFNDPRYLDKPSHDSFESCRQAILKVLE